MLVRRRPVLGVRKTVPADQQLIYMQVLCHPQMKIDKLFTDKGLRHTTLVRISFERQKLTSFRYRHEIRMTTVKIAR